MTSPFDLSTLSGEQSTTDLGIATRYIAFNDTGSKFFASNGTDLREYNLSTNYDITTISALQYLANISGSEMKFSTDGTKVFVTVGALINEYHLSTAFDLSTIGTIQATKTVLATYHTGLMFSADGTSMWRNNGTKFIEYELTTGFDLTTCSAHPINIKNTGTKAIADYSFNDDGTRIIGFYETYAQQFDL
ncbi:MAG: hypothetical protein HQL71_13175 [Magnetococcales bacterium]|nr:hypothetical protein [Magnetococcales bacterium]